MSYPAVAIAAVVLLLGAPVASRGQEHPEHPKGGSEHPAKGAQEHPKKEHPKSGSERHAYTVEDMGKAIEDFVRTDSALKGGSFLVLDSKTASVLQLKLTKVHKDKLAEVGAGLYFACADFQAADGKSYDLDFFMKEGAEALVVSEISVHKVGGVPRYGWQETDGLWKKVAVK